MHGIVPTGQRWEGHEGARQFYTSFLGAFPDVKFNLMEIVIGPLAAPKGTIVVIAAVVALTMRADTPLKRTSMF